MKTAKKEGNLYFVCLFVFVLHEYRRLLILHSSTVLLLLGNILHTISVLEKVHIITLKSTN